jgi:hypothetical protein
MKLLSMTLLILLFSVVYLTAQDDQLDQLNFEEQNYEQFKEESTPYFVIGGGPVMNMMFLNYNDINTQLVDKYFNNKDKFFMDGSFYQFGAQGIISIGLIPNVRIGIIGLGGQKSLNQTLDTAINSKTYNRNMEITLGYTGINLDYAWVPFNSIKFAIVPGVTLGWGTIDIKAYQTLKELDFNDIRPESDLANYNMKLATSYWHIAPMLNFEYSPTLLSLFRVSVGYTMSFPGTWNFNSNGDSKVNNVPTGINSNGLTLQFGIILGIFNY